MTTAYRHGIRVRAGDGKAAQGAPLEVRIQDNGAGILIEDIPRATLERGYTTAGTMGHGFWIILKTADRVAMLTGPDGTTIVVEQDRIRPQAPWLRD